MDKRRADEQNMACSEQGMDKSIQEKEISKDQNKDTPKK